MLLSVRVPDVLSKEAVSAAKEDGFSSTQELVREALRKYLEERRWQRASRDAQLIWGIAKGKRLKTLSQKERDKLVREITGRSGVND